MNEEIVCIIEDQSRSFKAPGRISVAGPIYVRQKKRVVQYDLFFTNKRIIAAAIFSSTTDMPEIWVEPFSSFVVVKNWMQRRKERREQFKGKTPDEILELHPDSFEIPYKNIKSVQVKKGLFGASLEITAVWEGEQRKIKIPFNKKEIQKVEDVVNRFLREKL